MKHLIGATLSLALLALTNPGVAAEREAGGSRHTDRLIIKLHDTQGDKRTALNHDRVSRLSGLAGITLTPHRRMSGRAEVVRLPAHYTIDTVKTFAASIAEDPDVDYVEPDYIRYPMATPDDTHYDEQWHLHDVTDDSEPGSANLEKAWDITTGSASVVTAVLDTGLLPHTDIVADGNINDGDDRVVPGYDFVDYDDFVSDDTSANDGDGRDTDPTDPGDWVTNAESSDAESSLFGCFVADSSWHGTHVAGTIAADSDNNSGVAGVDWVGKLLPVRVLGKCGGYNSDITDGMRWAAGLSVPGVPDNANPAKVLNLSLGGYGDCSTTEQNTIDAVTAAGAVVVVAAGNDAWDVSISAPANCNDVIAVAAVDRAGGLASYSNYGTLIDIAAPGGDTNEILSTLDGGTTTANNDNSYLGYVGTSMATPHVAGVAALMFAIDPTLLPSEVETILTSTARTFPLGTGSAGGDCHTPLCGEGILDAHQALIYTRDKPLIAPLADHTITSGDNLNIPISVDYSGTTAPIIVAAGQPTNALFSAGGNGSATITLNSNETNNDSSYNVIVIATDGDDHSLVDYERFTITVENAAPILTTLSNRNASAGTMLEFTVTASDVDGSNPRLTVSDLPLGATYDDNHDGSANFNWTPGSDQGGSHEIIFTATDRSNNALIDRQTITVTVSNTSSGSSGGGGGSLGLLPLFVFLAMLSRRLKVR
ncbi:S8 family serine peptidase [Solemya pervernicosa gill symbiont]|uniref:S8 family serine peptidase n=1 Tax=Solemya pervernicosa gill symbiont TaxID=642797 RepID=UPI001F014A77|nr:S8 family serine peptidase [Solemya pervernicosa gill symbiont]